MNTKQEKIEALFDAALKLPPDQRPVFLASACGGDADLRLQLETLLRTEAEAGDFLLEQPQHAKPVAAPITEKPGDRIGRYKLLQKIGEGGCGVVYVAEQEEPVRRRVALKVIKLGMDTKAFIARFEAELQALAMMDHPCIAKVHDAGSTDTGRPFFAMELVGGIPITKYCDENHLTPKDRLELFIKVCQAIQHAHQKGIIHRDIKPSNILVTVNDGAPTPKVIDFGIAKATQGKLTDATVFTAFDQFIGTPGYMSPEQAPMSSPDIDTRSDIYSLGVLLYELLTGCPPFDRKFFAQASLDEICRLIREAEPPTPSRRLHTLDEAKRTTIAELRSIAPAQLSLLLTRDLDWIVMRCIEKDRVRRYDTANGLAMDIQRHLRNEPVTARPPSTAYLLQRLVRRHRLAFGAGAVVVSSLVVGFGIFLWSLRQKKMALDEALGAQKETLEIKKGAYLYVPETFGRLTAAVDKQNLSEIKALLKGGVDLNRTRDNAGRTVLMHAALQGQTSMAEALIGLGADPTLWDNAYLTFKDWSAKPSVTLWQNFQQIAAAIEYTRTVAEAQLRQTSLLDAVALAKWLLQEQPDNKMIKAVLQRAFCENRYDPSAIQLARCASPGAEGLSLLRIEPELREGRAMGLFDKADRARRNRNFGEARYHYGCSLAHLLQAHEEAPTQQRLVGIMLTMGAIGDLDEQNGARNDAIARYERALAIADRLMSTALVDQQTLYKRNQQVFTAKLLNLKKAAPEISRGTRQSNK